MFNLGNLLHTAIISIGVANATPICDRNENVVNDYTIELSELRTQTLTNNNQIINNYDLNYGTYNIASIGDAKYIVGQSSAYLEIYAYRYSTSVYKASSDTNENVQIDYIRNYEELDNLNKNYSSTETLYVYKITPYNYNVNTDITMQIVAGMNNFSIYQGNEIVVTNRYLYNAIYSTTQENWDAYLNKQLVKDTPKAIIQDIEDINNGFYYDKYENETQFTWNQENNRYEIELTLTLNIVPKKDNYFIINLAPLVTAYEDHNGIEEYPYEAENVMVTNANFSIFPATIRGTNVIADTTNYEVIDIPGLMFNILSMPFAFVSQAFNLTLFPGTPYQINIANLFLSIIAILIFVTLISLIIKLKG